MNKLITVFVFIAMLIIPNLGQAVIVHSPKLEPAFKLNEKELCEISKIDVENKIGRKQRLKEKIALKLITTKSKKLTRKSTDQPKKTDVFSIVGFSCGLAGLLSLIIFSGSLAILLALIFGGLAKYSSIIGLIKINRNPESRKGIALSISGLILGSALVIVALIIAFGYLV